MAYLDLINVRKQFGAGWAVENFNLNVEQGEFVSFLGPSGCGKTTTLRMIAGFETPTSGSIVLADRDIAKLPANKRNIGMVFQSYALFPNMTVADNIKFGMKIAKEAPSVISQRVDEMLNIIHMKEFGNRYPHQLSGGQQQRVALVRALAIRPQVLLLDEPLSALDAKIRVALRQEIRAIQRQLGITTIYVTHDQEEALSISDRIVVMSKGKIEQIGTPPEIYNTPATQFVASFIGSLNVLTAKVIDTHERAIELDGQRLIVHQKFTENAGQHISVAIRPEAIHFETEGFNPGNKLHGTVAEIYFLGSVVRIHIRLQDQFINVDMFNNPGAVLPKPGSAVTLAFTPEACRVLTSSTEHAQVSALPLSMGALA